MEYVSSRNRSISLMHVVVSRSICSSPSMRLFLRSRSRVFRILNLRAYMMYASSKSRSFHTIGIHLMMLRTPVLKSFHGNSMLRSHHVRYVIWAHHWPKLHFGLGSPSIFLLETFIGWSLSYFSDCYPSHLTKVMNRNGF